MSRDFILILGGGVVSLMTTLVVLFVSDYIYRRDELVYRKSLPPPKIITAELAQEDSPNPNDLAKAPSSVSIAQDKARMVSEAASAEERA